MHIDHHSLVKIGGEWKIVNVKAGESVLDAKGKVEPEKLKAILFDQFKNGYYAVGEKVAKAWTTGKDLMKK